MENDSSGSDEEDIEEIPKPKEKEQDKKLLKKTKAKRKR